MPIIQCDIREGRSEEQKQRLAREITRVVMETIDAPQEWSLERFLAVLSVITSFNSSRSGAQFNASRK